MIGIDMEQISRFEHWNEEGFKRVFSQKEIEYSKQFTNSLEHFCGFFCVKEAFVKAVDDDGLTYSQIEVLHTDSGKPYINKTSYIMQILRAHGAYDVDVSISHCKDYATAVVQTKEE